MPSRTCKVCGEKSTIATKDLKYLHEEVDFICSLECLETKIKSFKNEGQEEVAYIKASEIDPGSKTAAFSCSVGASFRSQYEADVADFLKSIAIDFKYEPFSFTFGVYTYTPDFFIPPPYNCFIEVKGLFGVGKKHKLTEFLRAYPEINYIFIPWTLRNCFVTNIIDPE